MVETIVKITGWETKGLRIPDWKVDTEIENENIALILMPSGMGKTTTLNLLRYSFFDYSKIIDKNEIQKLQPKNSKIKEGEFNLKLKINNSKFRIKITFDFQNFTMSYKTTSGLSEGTTNGLELPKDLKKYIDQEFIEKTFFNLELVENLFESSDAEQSIKKLYKLYYFSQIKNYLTNYLSEQQSKNNFKNSKKEAEELKIREKKILQQITLVEQENIKNENRYKDLINQKRKFEKEQKQISDKNTEIKNAISSSENKVYECENELKINYEVFFNKIKNPMNLNKEFRDRLNEFVSNLARLKIPKSVGESFFDDLIKESECICGNHMNGEMVKIILKNKESILSEETWLILTNIKTKITNNNNLPFDDIDRSLDNVNSSKRNLNIAINQKNQIVSNIDDARYKLITEKLTEVNLELKDLEKKFEEYNEKPDVADDIHEKSKKKLDKLLLEIQAQIAEATNTQNLNNKVNILKILLDNIEMATLKEIIQELVKKINLEIPRVMPYEKILVKDINKKIQLEGQDSASQGQLARIGYLFLITLLNRPNLNFPFVVDSPVTAMDDVSRKEIASTISNELKNQYIAFLLPTERDDFAEELEKKSKTKINFITAFNTFDKDSDHLIQQAKENNIPKEQFFNDGVVGYGSKFFYNFRGININE
jgi:DNA sulfur modification protein DndD